MTKKYFIYFAEILETSLKFSSMLFRWESLDYSVVSKIAVLETLLLLQGRCRYPFLLLIFTRKTVPK